MFIGHFGVAFAAKKLAPRTSLPVLIFAAEFIDVLWPAALIAGREHVRIQPGITSVTPLDFYYYPWTHSLLMVGLWAVAFGAVYYIARRYLAGAITCAALVLSHWFLDLVVHRPDLPLMPGSSAYYGLGLWHSRTATAMVELTISFVGVWLYISATSAARQDRRSRILGTCRVPPCHPRGEHPGECATQRAGSCMVIPGGHDHLVPLGLVGRCSPSIRAILNEFCTYARANRVCPVFHNDSRLTLRAPTHTMLFPLQRSRAELLP